MRILDNLATGKRENVDAIRPAGPGRLEWRGRRSRRGRLPAGLRGRRLRLSRGRARLGAALGGAARGDDSRQRARNRAPLSGGPGGARTARRLGLVLVGLRGHPRCPSEAMPCRRARLRGGGLAGEEFARVFSTTMDLPTVSLRYFNVFGPRQDPDSQYLGGDPALHPRARGGPPPDGLRRRRAEPRLHVRGTTSCRRTWRRARADRAGARR